LRLLGGQEDPRRLYAAADCFILPTRYDPFPNTVLEALAMGVPVIVGRRSGAAEILRAPGSGQVCDPGNVDGLAQRMREAARAGRSPEGSAAARSVAEHYGIDGMAQRLTTLYATLLAPAGGGRSK
jgi:UDP-glucose:(heptosyl)LPS alpha-1,3-glucosyltransferase